jgi:ankyrin repeat protein
MCCFPHTPHQKLLSFYFEETSLRNEDGMTPALIASMKGSLEVLQLLRNAKANLETPMVDGETPAFAAAQNGHVKVLQLLRDAKVNLETPSNDGTTPAFAAAQEGHVDVLRLLRNAGVDIAAPITVSCAIFSLSRPI